MIAVAVSVGVEWKGHSTWRLAGELVEAHHVTTDVTGRVWVLDVILGLETQVPPVAEPHDLPAFERGRKIGRQSLERDVMATQTFLGEVTALIDSPGRPNADPEGARTT